MEAKKGPGRGGKFFREVRAEMRKVSWPNRKELFNNTVVVLVTVLVMAAIVWVFDVALSFILTPFLK